MKYNPVAPTSVILIVAATSCSTAPVPDDQPYGPYTNLQVLSGDWSELLEVMLGNLRGLGLRQTGGVGCLHCHVGSMQTSMETWDFASDAKRNKRSAREMLRMVKNINEGHLSNLPWRTENSMQVTCYTCHAGRTNPTPLPDVLASHYDSAGIDATVTRYEELRERYYEGDAYDFRESSLIRLAAELTDRKAHDDALRILELNVETHPQSASAHRGVVRYVVERAVETDGEAGLRAVYLQLTARHVAGAFVWFTLDRVGWDFMGAGKVARAMTIFDYNVEVYPDHPGPVNSVANAYLRTGDTTEAISTFEASLELRPDQSQWVGELLEKLLDSRR